MIRSDRGAGTGEDLPHTDYCCRPFLDYRTPHPENDPRYEAKVANGLAKALDLHVPEWRGSSLMDEAARAAVRYFEQMIDEAGGVDLISDSRIFHDRETGEWWGPTGTTDMMTVLGEVTSHLTPPGHRFYGRHSRNRLRVKTGVAWGFWLVSPPRNAQLLPRRDHS